MTGIWNIFVFLLLPIPLILLLLLSIPLPSLFKSPIRRFVIFITEKVIFFTITGNLKVYTFAKILSTLLFLISAYESYVTRKNLTLSYGVKIYEEMKCLNWRAERNFWISLFSLTLWLILNRMRDVTNKYENALLELKERKEDETKAKKNE